MADKTSGVGRALRGRSEVLNATFEDGHEERIRRFLWAHWQCLSDFLDCPWRASPLQYRRNRPVKCWYANSKRLPCCRRAYLFELCSNVTSPCPGLNSPFRGQDISQVVERQEQASVERYDCYGFPGFEFVAPVTGNPTIACTGWACLRCPAAPN